ncbi:hypothetical protein ACWEPC_32565 [Nonomuraea sp. NPDC004297]
MAAELVLVEAVIGAGMFLSDPGRMAAATAGGRAVASARQWEQVTVQLARPATATTLSVFRPRRGIRMPAARPGAGRGRHGARAWQEAVRRALLTHERLVAVELPAHGSGVILATAR